MFLLVVDGGTFSFTQLVPSFYTTYPQNINTKVMNSRRTRNIYQPGQVEPFKLSRTKLEEFLRCPRCFYLDRRLGVGQPPGFPFNLNSAVDHLLKKEFDLHRVKKCRHPLMEQYGVNAIPFSHPNLEKWRENFVGVQYHHRPTNLIIFGAVDDVWVNPAGELIVVDYKATSKEGEVSLDAEWQRGYKNQMEIYQWLLRQNGFKVSSTGYFVYVNGRRDLAAFDGKLEFKVKLIPYQGDDAWVEEVIMRAYQCLLGEELPAPSEVCDYCGYRAAAREVEGV
jgi:hypothetical protein